MAHKSHKLDVRVVRFYHLLKQITKGLPIYKKLFTFFLSPRYLIYYNLSRRVVKLLETVF